MEPQPADPPASTPEAPDPSADIIPPPEANAKPGRHSSSSSSSSSSRGSSAGIVLNIDAGEMSTPLVATPPDDDDGIADADADAGPGAAEVIVVKPDDWVSWPESPPKAVVGENLLSVGSATQQGPGAQTMAKPENGGGTFNPDRIPASIFQAKQAEWSITSNESLFSIHGASHSQSDELYSGAAASRSHFDVFYDEAMVAGGGEQPGWRMPALEEVAEGAAVPGSAGSDASQAKKAMAFRRHESGSAGSSSNFSFAFPILAETSPRKKESVGGYQQLRKEYDQSVPATPVDPKSAFEEMTTEEERRRRKPGWCGCGECCGCGCCWFECSWSSCCCCCQWRWSCCQWRWRCCSCSCPSFCWCTCCCL